MLSIGRKRRLILSFFFFSPLGFFGEYRPNSSCENALPFSLSPPPPSFPLYIYKKKKKKNEPPQWEHFIPLLCLPSSRDPSCL
jgi:hypothetical protein